MDFSFDLRRWAEYTSSRPTVLSLFLDARGGVSLSSLHRQVREIENLYRQDRELRENFLFAIRQVRSSLKDSVPHCRALCFFVDPSSGLFQRYALPIPVENRLVLDTSPYIMPLARLQEDWEPFALVLMDHRVAHLYLVYLARISQERELKTEFLAHQKNGGWSQGRYSRRRRNQIEGFLREVSRDLSSLLREEPVNRIILAGSAEAKRELVSFLPKDIEEKVVGLLDSEMNVNEKSLLEQALPLFFAAEEREERALLEEIRDMIAASGLAVAGMDRVVESVVAARADTVVIEKGLSVDAWKCESCEVMEAGEAEHCLLCNERVYPVDLVEEVVEYAQKTGAEIFFIDPSMNLLKDLGGIAAKLRY